MNALFDFSQIDLSRSPALHMNILGQGLDDESIDVLREFETEYPKYVTIGEIHNYETAEVLVEAFGEFQQDKGLVYNTAEEGEEDAFDVAAMISAVQIVVTGTKHTLVLTVVPSFEVDEDDYDDSEDFE